MQGMNKVILAGNLTRDIELRYTPNGTAIAKFGLALNRKWKDQSGETKEEVTFVDVDAFGKQAEVLGQYLKKGHPLLMEGRLRLQTWDDKQTQQKRSRLSVMLESFTFLDSGERNDGGEQRQQQRSDRTPPPAKPQGRLAPQQGYGAAEGDYAPDESDDVPFAQLPRERITRQLTGVTIHRMA